MPRFRLALVVMSAAVAVFVLASSAQATASLPSTTVSNTGMVDFPGAGGTANAVAVRTIAQAGDNVWVGGRFDQIEDANGNKVADAANLAPFSASTGSQATGVHVPLVTSSAGDAEIYDSSLGPDGNLYFAGNFDAVDGQTRHNVAAIDHATGALLPFSPTGVGSANAVLATSTAIYVGTAKLLSFRLNGSQTPTWPNLNPPQVYIDTGTRAHATLPQVRDIQIRGNTLVLACQCDSLSDPKGTRNVKAAVEIDATTGNWIDWRPGGTDPTKTGYIDDTKAPFGISLVIHNAPGTSTPKVYLAAGGSDFTAGYDFATGAQVFKTDTSGSSQAIAWYQGNVVVGGHFEWTESPTATALKESCADNAAPNPHCYFSPKLVAMDASTGAVLLGANNAPWNPGICCKYNGVWALLVGSDGSTLHVGGEFTQAGGTWIPGCTDFASTCLSGKSLQQYYARFTGPAPATQTLSVQQPGPGAGSGTVTSSPSGIACGINCSNDFTSGANVTLTASFDPSNTTFTGWSSPDPGFSCPGTSVTCSVTMNQARSVVANFAPISFQLTVSKTGAGTGTLTSSPAGVSCGTTCTPFFVQGTTVTLTATAGTNSKFNGWSGDCAGTGTTCLVTMNQVRSVAAEFAPTTHTLKVTKTGAGSGSVVTSPSGINCGSTCGPKSFSDATVSLTATPAGGSAFAGWSSSEPGFNCPGTGACIVTMDMDRIVTADFETAKTITVTYPFSGTGSGAVSSSPGGIACPSTCVAPFVQGSSVTVTAAPDATSAFTGWSANCTPTGPLTCTIAASGTLAQRTVTATFAAAKTLTVTPAGTGGGTVTSTPAGINCGLSCQANFPSGTPVTLSAAPDANSTFTGWSGACIGNGTCQVTMNAAASVTATFTPVQRTLTMDVAGQGSVTSNPAGIDCTSGNSGTCLSAFEHGSDVQLDVVPDANYAFTGWGGACSGTDPSCIVTMDGDQTVTATFSRVSRTVDVKFDGSGSGSVTSNPAGIDCPAGNCSAVYAQGDTVGLTATADPGSVFTGWSGACAGSADCVLTIDGAKSVVATFQPLVSLTVDTSGTGSVTSDTGGIACPGTCSAQYALGTSVTLTAQPDAGTSFAGWGGACSGSATTCPVTIDTAKNVTASFGSTQQLGFSVTGSGTGSVTSDPAGINCATGNSGACSAGFAQGSSVTLTATPSATSLVASWGGDCATATGNTCQVTMDQARSASVEFEPSHILTVTPSGTGTGSVTSTPSGVTCPSTCSSPFQEGSQVTLNASPGASSTFDGWSGGGCSGTGACTLTLSGDTTVTATFTQILDPVSITENGTGGGTVVSNPAGVNCPSTCGASFPRGGTVALTTAPDSHSVFTGWSGDCSGTTNPCQLSINAAKNVTATFDKAPRQLSVSVTGSGSVTSSPAGINCPTTCSASYPDGTLVTLTETPSGGATFGGWGGDCSSAGATCQITLDAAKSVTATFGSGVSSIEEMDPIVAYDGWSGVTDATANGGTYRVSSQKGDKATWKSPISTALTWVTRKGPNLGIAKVTIDGTSKGTVDLYAPTAQAFSQTYQGLASKAHTVIVMGTGTKNASSSSTGVVVDAFTAGTTTDQDSAPTVKYNTWASAASSKASGGTYRWATASTARVTVTFAGSGIDWITEMGPTFGKASVSIDGTNLTPTPIDLYSSSAKWQQKFSFTGLSSGVHAMVIQVLGTKNAAATSTKVAIDAFKIYP